MDTVAHQLALQAAYLISEELADRSTKELFWALDRFDWDRNTLTDEDAREQRNEATQRIALELDRRNVPVRNPALPSTYSTERPAPMKPNSFFEIIRPDEVAECWDGVSSALSRALWACVSDYKAPSPEVSEEPCIGLDSVADFWDRFTDAEKAALNELAEKQGEF